MESKKIARYVGKQIKKHRLLSGLTQKELGEKIGVKHNTISTYESGINAAENDVLFAIAKTLDISINDLFPPIKDNFIGVIASEIAMLPIVGRICCGEGSSAYGDIEGYEPTPKEWINGGNYFYLRAKGDSMTGARIYDGDLLLIREQPDVENGEIAAVVVNNEDAVLKRVYRSDGQIVLQSENQNYPPIFAPPVQIRIIGKLKRTIIKY